MSNQTFTSRRALEVMDKIDAFLEDRRRASSAEVAALIGMSQVQTGCYLVQMEKIEQIHCIERPMHTQGGRTQTIWGRAPRRTMALMLTRREIRASCAR